jgi:3-hydroxybutyryl-CoA dehydratase
MNPPEIAPLTKQLDQAMLDAYARASGDFNPIHIDAEFAKATPFGGTIAHGMLVLAFISEMMTAAFAEQWLRKGQLDVRFRSPARPGDLITARATPAKPAEGFLKYSVECVNQKSEVLISGTAQVAL